jgi:hypothetical protein
MNAWVVPSTCNRRPYFYLTPSIPREVAARSCWSHFLCFKVSDQTSTRTPTLISSSVLLYACKQENLFNNQPHLIFCEGRQSVSQQKFRAPSRDDNQTSNDKTTLTYTFLQASLILPTIPFPVSKQIKVRWQLSLMSPLPSQSIERKKNIPLEQPSVTSTCRRSSP